jgi:integrase
LKRRGKGEGAIFQRGGDGRWVATLTLEGGGKRQRKSFYGRTRAEVAKRLTAALKAQQDNLAIPSERQMVGAFLDAWLNDVATQGLRPRTLASYRMIARLHLNPELGRIPLARLSPSDVQRYMTKMRASGLSTRTVQYHHAVLRRALQDAERWGKVSRNVARLVSPPRVERPEIRPLTAEQARVLVDAISADRHAALYLMALGLGLRQGELLGLQWTDVDLEAGTVSVNHTLQRYGRGYHLDPPKTDRSHRTVALSASLVQQLKAHRTLQLAERVHAGPAWQGEEWNLVFCTEAGIPCYGSHLTRRFQSLLKSLGLPRQRFHDLRHAAATFMLAQGVDLRVVMEVLGHSQIGTTANTYAHVRVEATRAAVEQVDALLSR